MSIVQFAAPPAASFDDVVSVLRSAGEPTRLRLLALLSLGEATVKTHVARVLGKLGLRDRIQAVVLAYETGYVQPGAADRPGTSPHS